MHLEIKHYSELSIDEFHDIIQLRIAVFIVEQDCPYMEVDGLDRDAWHLIVRGDDGSIIGTLRILKEGVVYDELAIGRVVSHKDQRDKKIGHLMMEETMRFIKNELGNVDVRLSGQTHLVGFYEKYNFIKTGNEYLEDGIPHSEMIYKRERIN